MQIRKTLTPVLAATALALGAGSAWAQDVTLKIHHFLAPNATSQKLLLGPWCEKIGKESNNRIKCQIYPAMQTVAARFVLPERTASWVATA